MANRNLDRALMSYGKAPARSLMTPFPKRDMVAFLVCLAKAKAQLPVFNDVPSRVPTFKRGNKAHVVL